MICNASLLYLTAYFLKWKIHIIRFISSTCIATSYVLLLITTENFFFHSLITKLVFSILILWLAFGRKIFQKLWLTMITFYSLYMFMGGALLGIHYVIQANGSSIQGINKPISASYVLSAFPIIAFVAKKQADFFIRKKFTVESLYRVDITMYGKTVQVNGLMDTGNQLYDPITNKPVIFASSTFFKQIFTQIEWQQIQSAVEMETVHLLPTQLKRKLVTIPYQDVSGMDQIIYTWIADEVSIIDKDVVRTSYRIPIGIQFSHLTADHAYECLLHPGMIIHGKN